MATRVTPETSIPGHLAGRGRDFFAAVVREYILEPHHLETLVAACELLMRADSARKIVDVEGLTVADRFGQSREHAACAIERSSLLAAARLVRQLGLDLPSAPGGRR